MRRVEPDLNAMGALTTLLPPLALTGKHVIGYLQGMAVALSAQQQVPDSVDPSAQGIGLGWLTDGKWVISFESAAYVTRYGMGLPEEMLLDIQRAGGVSPSPSPEQVEAARNFIISGEQPPEPPAPEPPVETLATEPTPLVEQSVVPAGDDAPEGKMGHEPSDLDSNDDDDDDDDGADDDSDDDADLDVHFPSVGGHGDGDGGESVSNASGVSEAAAFLIVDEDTGKYLRSEERRHELPLPSTYAPEQVAAFYEGDWDALVGNRAWEVWDFVDAHGGFSEAELHLIWNARGVLMTGVESSVRRARQRYMGKVAKASGLTSTERFSKMATEAVLTRLEGPVSTSGDMAQTEPVSQVRELAAGFIGELFASAVLSDLSGDWADSSFGGVWDNRVFRMVRATVTTSSALLGSFSLNESGLTVQD